MQLYYEIYGQGKPMVLLHGGITAFEGFGTNIDALAKSRQVIAVHLQGHGNTADIDRPYRFEALADDVAALVAYLKLGKIDLVGYSFGGGVALQTANSTSRSRRSPGGDFLCHGPNRILSGRACRVRTDEQERTDACRQRQKVTTCDDVPEDELGNVVQKDGRTGQHAI
jgi:surfactin synthase thioesterase subunit